MEEDIYQKLVGDPVVAAILGDRIYQTRIADGNIFPALAFELDSDIEPCAAGKGYAQGTLDVMIFGSTKEQVVSARKAVIDCLDGWNSVSLRQHTGEWEVVMKKYGQFITFKIAKQW